MAQFLDTIYVVDTIIKKVIKKYCISLGETERYFKIVMMAVYNAIRKGATTQLCFPDEKGASFLTTYFVPVLLGALDYPMEIVIVVLFDEILTLGKKILKELS